MTHSVYQQATENSYCGLPTYGAQQACAATDFYLRVRILGTVATGEWSTDQLNWTVVGVYSGAWLSDSTVTVGLFASNGGAYPPEIPADFDYFRVDSLPTVCGSVSGVWDAAHSPYYVTCDVTVPAGDTLRIEPGVRVEFLGPYSLTAYGTLLAEGTEQDSIAFTTDLTDGNRWQGLRFWNSGSTGSELAHCVIEKASSPLGGGGIHCNGASPSFRHCLITENYSSNNGNDGGGGGIELRNLSNAIFTNCLIRGNTAFNTGGGVNIATADGIFDHCVFDQNAAGWGGGGLFVYVGCAPQIINCTFWGTIRWSGWRHPFSVWRASRAEKPHHCKFRRHRYSVRS